MLEHQKVLSNVCAHTVTWVLIKTVQIEVVDCSSSLAVECVVASEGVEQCLCAQSYMGTDKNGSN